jgi:hypothetical protein
LNEESRAVNYALKLLKSLYREKLITKRNFEECKRKLMVRLTIDEMLYGPSPYRSLKPEFKKTKRKAKKEYHLTFYCRRFSVVRTIVMVLTILAIIFFRDLLVLPTIYGFIVGGILLLSYALFSLVRKKLEL